MRAVNLPREWWKDSVVYQIYTRSFLDSNGDGIGDFGGVLAKLDYLQELGVDVVWLSPFCDSPNDDNGYDISDYYTVHPEFGTMEDFTRMVSAAHQRGIKIMMDLVMNHTSDEHPWFVESRSSLDNPKRDWYIWRDAKPDGGLPNNWDSYFGGSAWQYDERTGQYYLHTFSTKQPDLNWANPEVREEMYRITEFWINRGVNAFRLDAVHHIGKPEGLPDFHPPRKGCHFRLYKNLPETHTYLQEMHDRIFAIHNVFTVGETGGTNPKSSRLYVDKDRGELNMIHHFEQLFLPNPGDAAEILRNQQRWYRALSKKGWDAQFFSNHDLPRQLSVFGSERIAGKSATAIATILLTAWGTPFIYQGEEIGMRNFPFTELSQFRDRHALRLYHDEIARGEDPELAWAKMTSENRDNSRTPMQWSAQPNAGFTTGTPWIGVHPQYAFVNVAQQQDDPYSVLNFYRKLLQFRKEHPVLRRGSYRPIHGFSAKKVLAYTRGKFQNERVFVLVNWSESFQQVRIPRRIAGKSRAGYRLLVSNYPRPEAGIEPTTAPASIPLRPYEARMYIHSVA
ncbi:MAG: alpha-glucosidase [Spirochaeta sp.]